MPPHTLTHTLEDSISSKTWKNREKTLQNTSSIDFLSIDASTLSKLKKFWSLSPSFRQASPQRILRNTKKSLKRWNLSSNHCGHVRLPLVLPYFLLWWSLAQPKVPSSVFCCLPLPKSSLVGLATQWLTTDIHFSWSTAESSQQSLEVSAWNGGALNITCITSSLTVNFTTMTSSTITKSICTNSCTWNGDSIQQYQPLPNSITYLFNLIQLEIVSISINYFIIFYNYQNLPYFLLGNLLGGFYSAFVLIGNHER